MVVIENGKRARFLLTALVAVTILIILFYNMGTYKGLRQSRQPECHCEMITEGICSKYCESFWIPDYSQGKGQIQDETTPYRYTSRHDSLSSTSISDNSSLGDSLSRECFSSGPGKRIVTLHSRWFCSDGGLGNKMFMMASAIGIACRNAAAFMLPTAHCNEFDRYRTLFSGLATLVGVIDGNLTSSWPNIGERNHMFFSDYELTQNSNYTVSGYRQSWRYFLNYSSSIKSVYQINSTVLMTVRNILQQARDNFNGSTLSKLVGVHVRQGDLRNGHLQEFGYVMANRTFYEKALPLMAQTLNTTDIIFIVTSDSMKEAKELLHSLEDKYKIFYVEGLKNDEDFAVLSRTEHLIITGGTYGFWAAWLSGGRVIYFSGYARPGSQLTKDGYNLESAFLPTWIPLDDLPVTS